MAPDRFAEPAWASGQSRLWAYERKTNSLLHLAKEKFLQHVLDSMPPVPRYYPQMKQLNSRGAPFSRLHGATGITPVELQSLMAEGGVVVLDLRRPEAFGGAHIQGSVNIDAGQNLSLWAGWLISPDSRIVLVNDTGDDENARCALERVG
jgi:hydroxyacylglutathione hydrolase